jgi:hypothetical protein
MWCERPQNIFFGAKTPRTLTPGEDPADVPKLPFPNELNELQDMGVIPQKMADHEDPRFFARQSREVPALRNRERERFLHEDVLARLEPMPDMFAVQSRRRCERDRIAVRVGEKFGKSFRRDAKIVGQLQGGGQVWIANGVKRPEPR